MISSNSNHREWSSFLSVLSTGKEPVEVPVWLVVLLTYLNEYSFWMTGIAPLGFEACIMVLDFITPLSFSTKHNRDRAGVGGETAMEGRFEGVCCRVQTTRILYI